MSFPPCVRAVTKLIAVALVMSVLSACKLPPAAFAEAKACRHTGPELSWAPPELADPVSVHIEADFWQRVYELDPDQDYRIELPDEPVRRGLIFVGGRNLVLIGGEIAIPWQGANASITSRTALKIKGATGTVHLEGLLLRGQDISEGIQIDAPDAEVQIENVGIFNIHARDQVNFSDNHPDLIQTYGNVKALRIDRFTGSTDYQGLFFAANFNGTHGPVDLRRVNIIGNATARNLLWLQPQAGAGDVTLDQVYLDAGGMTNRNLSEAVWPNGRGKYPDQVQVASLESVGQTATWPETMQPRVRGYVMSSRPPQGDFVSPNHIGVGYCSGSYQDKPDHTVLADDAD